MSRNGDPSRDGAGGSGRGSSSTEYFVDTKLLFRLKHFVGEQNERGSLVTEDAALDYLLDKFKEYVRKPQVRDTVRMDERSIRGATKLHLYAHRVDGEPNAEIFLWSW